jgi:CheY-like chemotaxis protein
MASILIIDDDQDVIESMTMILEGNGHRVSVKTDTENVVDFVMSINPDLVILDIIFPDDPHAGFTAARALEANDKVKNIPVLMLSAVNQKSNLSFGFTESDISDDFMPVEGFLEKPIEPLVLLTKVKELLGG